MPFSLPAMASDVGLPGGTVAMALPLQTMGPGVGRFPLSLLTMVPGEGTPDGTVVHTLPPGDGTTWQQCSIVLKYDQMAVVK